jgi:hypothetical protein
MTTTTQVITTVLNENVTYVADDETIGFDSRTFAVLENADGTDHVEIWLDRQAEDRLLSSLLARKAAREA